MYVFWALTSPLPSKLPPPPPCAGCAPALPRREPGGGGRISCADAACTWTAGTSRHAFILKLSIMLRGSHPGPELQNWHLGMCSAVKTDLAGQLCRMKKML